ncbi:MAG: calcineurin-like phosphoesterase family protein [bacterium]
MKILRVTLLGLIMAFAICLSAQVSTLTNGVVFNDLNGNNKLDTGEKGLPGVGVSNGTQIVVTDKNGRYSLPLMVGSTLFVIKPKGWMTPINADKLWQSYYIRTEANSHTKDFALTAQKEPTKFKVILFADSQVGNMEDVNYLAHDAVEELVGNDAAFGITLGDICQKELSLAPEVNRVIAQIGIPWYYLQGNHDITPGATDDNQLNSLFTKLYGPAVYSFNYGPAHFLVLNTSVFDSKTQSRSGLSPDELEFVKNDLALVPKNQLVVVVLHIPLNEIAQEDSKQFFALLEKFPNVVALSGHKHFQRQIFMGAKEGWNGKEPLHMFMSGAVCGDMWSGQPDEMGIPNATNWDGTPNGYCFLNVSGNKYTIDYKAARKPANYQMNIYAPNEVKASDETEIVVNVFNGSPKSKVEMRIDTTGNWLPMKSDKRYDPNGQRLVQEQQAYQNANGNKLWHSRPINAPNRTEHIWIAKLPFTISPGIHQITIRHTDMYGRTVTAVRLINVK